MWISSGRVANPAANAVLADSGPLTDSVVSVSVIAAASVASLFELQHRNAANTDPSLATQIIAVPASGTVGLAAVIPNLHVADGERLRMVQVAVIAGQASVSIGIA